MTKLFLSNLCALAWMTAGCQTVTATNIGDLKPSTDWVANSEEWRVDAEAVYAGALAYVSLEAQSRPMGSWIVTMDVDETILNNVQYQIERDLSGTDYSDPTWVEWTNRKSAPAVPGAVAFINSVNRLGGHIALVTNRRDTEQLVTELNLSDVGLKRGRDFRVLLTRARPNAPGDKQARFDLVAPLIEAQSYAGAEVIAYIGDNIGDKPATSSDDWTFFCIDQGAMYGDPCATVPGPGR
jgi:5'-nucleotidase (lipoprotein e(P4) family)